MPVTKEVELLPFIVPDCVGVKMAPGKRQDGLKPGLSYKLHELDDKTLNQLCDIFRAEVLSKARAGRSEGEII